MESESEITTAIIGLIASVLILLAAALSFLDNRLNRAESAEARERVAANVMFALVMILNIAGGGAIAFFSSSILPAALYTCAFLIIVGSFVRKSAPIGRGEMAVFSIYVAAYAVAITLIIVLHFLSRTLDIIDRIIS